MILYPRKYVSESLIREFKELCLAVYIQVSDKGQGSTLANISLS